MEDEAVKGFLRIRLAVTIITVSTIAGCSWLQSRQSLFSNEVTDDDGKPLVTTVPKEQYDQLLKKYDALQTRLQTSEASGEDVAAKIPNEALENSEILGALQNANDGDLAETVDVFASNNAPAAQAVVNSDNYDNVDVESQIRKLQQADAFVVQNKFDDALNNLKSLEKSPVRQIRVRARFLIGETLFKQGDFDLSMQIFEEIIQKDAFSGTVLKALGRLIVCTEKLKLDKKKEQYYSLLHDFFES